MLGPLPLSSARVVVELGSGTGVMTQALLRRIPFNATLFAFEINPRFSRYLRSAVSDPRLVVVNASAETLRQELSGSGCKHVDAVVSSLALGFMSDPQRRTILGEISSVLHKDGAFTQYQYLHGLELRDGQLSRFDVAKLLRRHFRSVQRKIIWRNLPPAFVFVCRKPWCSERLMACPTE